MGQQLRIEGDEAVALATELAALTGESVAAAVTGAMRQRLARELDRQQRRARVMAVIDEIRVGIDTSLPAPDHDALLYDGRTGLPK